jgi:hypothetical protein
MGVKLALTLRGKTKARTSENGGREESLGLRRKKKQEAGE